MKKLRKSYIQHLNKNYKINVEIIELLNYMILYLILIKHFD